MTTPAEPSAHVAETAAILAAHTHKDTHWSRKDSPAVSVCICEVETPLELPADRKHVPDAELTKADRAAHAKHLAEVIAESGYVHVGEREIIVPAPSVPHKALDKPDSHYMRTAARNLEGGYGIGGYNVTHTVIKLLRDTAAALDTIA